MNNIVSLNKVSKRYASGRKNVLALDAIDFELPEGESAVFVGPSGSGKSTLLQLIGGLDRPDTGAIYVHDKNINTLNDTELSAFRNKHVGFVFQFFNLHDFYTVQENVALPMLLAGKSQKESYERAEHLLHKVGIKHRLNHLPKELSGGEMQRVAIARSLAMESKLILADEPTGNLDHDNAVKVLDLFEEIAHSGVSLIIVTHDSRVSDRFDRVVKMEGGSIKSDKRKK